MSLWKTLSRSFFDKRDWFLGRKSEQHKRSFAPKLEILEDRLAPAVFTVTNVLDSGVGSFRHAIEIANLMPTRDQIEFDIVGLNTRILLQSPLPAITDRVDILGGAVLDGRNLDSQTGYGLRLDTSHSVMNGLALHNFPLSAIKVRGSNNLIENNQIGVTKGIAVTNGNGTGVHIDGSASEATGNVIRGNLIGGNGTGIKITGENTTSNRIEGNQIGVLYQSNVGNTYGIYIDEGAGRNIIGGPSPDARNIISGNNHGIFTFFSSGNVIQGNYIGTDVSGAISVPNTANGLWIRFGTDNTIGGLTPVAGNVISGNDIGVLIQGAAGANNKVQGNYIGIGATGKFALPNNMGLLVQGQDNLIGGTTPGAGNVISGNTGLGIRVQNRNNDIVGNFIGTDVTGMLPLGNGSDGVQAVYASAVSNLVGNVISGNGGAGVHLINGVDGFKVHGNLIGTNRLGTYAIPNTHGVHITAGERNFIGGTAAGEGNVISGNAQSGILIEGAETTGNIVAGNLIGTNADGTQALRNVGNGVQIRNGAAHNIIGGTSDSARNVISGNAKSGVILGPANPFADDAAGAGNTIQGNFIGTTANGDLALGNQREGILVLKAFAGTDEGVSPTVISQNVISANSGFGGIRLQRFGDGPYISGVEIKGNRIGTNSDGTFALGNFRGIDVAGGKDILIGGTSNEERNVISGSDEIGVFLRAGTTRTRVIGNFIGTDANGTGDLGNGADPTLRGAGVQIDNAPGNTIGGTQPGEGNVIAGNATYGVILFAPDAVNNVVQGNRIGLGIDGSPLGNDDHGVYVLDAGNNTIGGLPPQTANTIAFNGGDGVAVEEGEFAATGNAILGNAIFENTELGIDLGDDGVTPNDSDDADKSANNLQNFPVLLATFSDGTTVAVKGTLRSTANSEFRIELFTNSELDPTGFGEGETFLGATTVTTDDAGLASFAATFEKAVPLGHFITATATNLATNDTSEFSKGIQAGAPNQAPAFDPMILEHFVNEGEELSLTVTATDPDLPDDTLTFSLDKAPDGANIDPISGKFTWTPAQTQGPGTFQVSVRVTDDDPHNPLSDTAGFIVQVNGENEVPVLAEIADQNMSHMQDTLTVALQAKDPNDQELTFSAEAVPYDPIFAQDQQLGLVQKGGYYTDWMGQNEKWLFSSTYQQWYYLLPNGELRQWSSSEDDPVLETFGAEVWANPKLLHEAKPTADTVPVTLTIDGEDLVIDPENDYAGRFQVDVTVSDGIDSDTGSFLVTVTNYAPVFQARHDEQSMSHNEVLRLDITADDADSEHLTYEARASAYDPLYQLDQEHDLIKKGGYYTDWMGENEKWLFSNTHKQWHYLLPNGELRQWGTSNNHPLTATFDGEVWADPAMLHEAQPPTIPVPVDLTMVGSTLIVDAKDTDTGTSKVSVTASDGHGAVTQSFLVTTTNQAPVFQTIHSDQTISQKQTLVLDVTGNDADGDYLTYEANARIFDPLFELDQQLDLVQLDGTYFTDFFGQDEKWIFSNSENEWYFLLPTGALHRWDGSASAGGPEVTNVGAAVYVDPSLLHEAEPPSGALPVTLTTEAFGCPEFARLIIKLDETYVGTFVVTVLADDGIARASQSFLVTATNFNHYADFNGDGFDDLAIGVPGETVNGELGAGGVNVIYGSEDGLHQDQEQQNQLWTQDSPSMKDFAEVGDRFGSALAAGDFNGDGYDDLAIGVPGERVTGQSNAGAVHVLYGSLDGLNGSLDDLLLTQNTPGIEDQAEQNDSFGAVLTVGNFNGDEYDDLAIGVPREDLNEIFFDTGAVHVIYGFTNGLAANNPLNQFRQPTGLSAQPGVRLGASLASGDFDADGYDELAIGAPFADLKIINTEVTTIFNAGSVAVVNGSENGLRFMNDPSARTFHQNSPGIVDEAEGYDLFGAALATGDFNGDGYDDLAIGVPSEDVGAGAGQRIDAGAVHVIYGSPVGLRADEHTIEGQNFPDDQVFYQGLGGIKGNGETGDRFGFALTEGDFDGDGRDDLAIGAPSEDVSTKTDAGAVNVIYGSPLGLHADELNIDGLVYLDDQLWTQDTAGVNETAESFDRFGAALAVGDFNRDGKAELSIGVPGEHFDGFVDGFVPADVGAVNLLYGFYDGLTVDENQLWRQGASGVLGEPDIEDQFGSALG